MHGRHCNVLEIQTAPLLPLPGTFKTSPANEAGSRVTQHAEMFDSLCKLQVIGNDILWQYHGVKSKRSLNNPSMEFAETAYRRLLSWTANLPINQARGDQSNHGIILMQ
jgi:hypothetical protein